MKSFAKQLEDFAREHKLSALRGKRLFRKGNMLCRYRKMGKLYFYADPWPICTHPKIRKTLENGNKINFECSLDYCPYVSAGFAQAYKVFNKENK